MTDLLFWLVLGALALAALLPLGLALLRPPRARGRREADLALFEAQRAELAREAEAGRLAPEAHRAALLELQRRLLAAPEDAAARGGGKRLLAGLLVAVPVAAFGLYLATGTPGMPSAPYTLRREVAERDAAMLAQLRARLAQMPPNSPQARTGWLLLGNAERGRGELGAAAEAFQRALAMQFDPDLAGQLAQVLLEDGKVEEASRLLAESLPRAPGHIGLRFLSGLAEERAGRPANARRVWQALLADAPEDVPWRGMVERRLQSLP
ncbi:c-type cytochrome biogenesis protein CcmI [Siccirubricoccus phaeus]|uniref:c-type cytochrome biogenesis protein CcmI n=1 Tax=Siccirubricoccus phaeus TaxID=2595053 RepID=UPI0011F2F7C0|nr:c-type cytochrome biogenesis protein CcmI [Siccirubricoccus phaeus]